jgi:hypothetical protein
MKKFLVIFVSITSIFVLLGLIFIYFKENIFNVIKLSRTNISAIPISPDVQILLYLSLIGLIVFFRSRSYKK